MKSHKGKKKRFKNQKNSQKKGPIKHVSQAPKEVAQLDPDSPFAALAGLKEQLKGKK
jgi:ATP-dependent RNA helicase SUPV3L1/SUV3